MRSDRLTAMVLVGFLLAASSWAQERDELLANPKYAKDARVPQFVDLTAEQVAQQVTMTAGRNYAWFGFNTPEIHVVLPSADNSVYADVDFAGARLLDAKGQEVRYELERGLYDHDSHHDELRFTPLEGDEPVEFARAVGTVTIRYPLRLRTVVARKGGPAVAGLDVSFDGPYLTRRTRSGAEDLEGASFTGIETLRALDTEGRQLEPYPAARMSVVDDVTTEIKTYWGEVHEVQLDVADEWATIRVAYELPAVEPLPESRAGVAPPDGDENPPTPNAKIEVEVAVETPGTIVAAELGVTPDEAEGRLRTLGIGRPSGDSMVMGAVQGKMKAVKLHLAAGFSIDFAVGERTALVSAVMYRHIDLARFLVAAGADVNLADANNATPLFHAAGNCDATELVKELVAAGADPTPATRGATTALEMAAMMGCADNEAIIRAALGR